MEEQGGSESQLLQSELEDELKCPLCGDFMHEVTTTAECNHSFCKKCILVNLARQGSGASLCPVCSTSVDVECLRSNGKLSKIASIFRAKKSLQERASAAAHPLHTNTEIGYEMLYYFLQYTKAKQVQFLHEVKNKVLSLDQDLTTVKKRLGEATGIGLVDPNTGATDPKQLEIIQQKVRDDLRRYPHLVNLVPKLDKLYTYNPDVGTFLGPSLAGGKRKAGAGEGTSGYNDNMKVKRREQYVDQVADTLHNISKHNRLKLEVEIPSGDMLQKSAIISSIGFNSKHEYFATAGVSKRIKIYDIENVVKDRFRIPCPILELTWRSKLSDLDWNKHHNAHLATSDYDGMISVWDIDSGENILEYDEHEKRAWSVNFSKTDASLLASGSDDGTVKIYSTKQNRSVLMVETVANVCSVQYHPTNFHYVAVGCSDHQAYVYDLRQINQPVVTLSGHNRAISYAAYSKDSELLTASTDNTLRLWNVVSGETKRVLSGHVNQKHFVGLALEDEWVAVGSETNELFVYNKSVNSPIHQYSFDEGEAGGQTSGGSHFISATCWKPRSNIILCASSDGNLRVLSLD